MRVIEFLRDPRTRRLTGFVAGRVHVGWSCRQSAGAPIVDGARVELGDGRTFGGIVIRPRPTRGRALAIAVAGALPVIRDPRSGGLPWWLTTPRGDGRLLPRRPVPAPAVMVEDLDDVTWIERNAQGVLSYHVDPEGRPS